MKRHPTKAPALALLALALSACNGGTSSSATPSSSQQSQGSSSAPASSSKSEAKFTVTWKNEDGSVLKTDTDVSDGAVPVYDGAIPTKAGDAAKSYRFVGWTPTVAAIHADATYTARFVEVPNKYTVTWKNYDGSVLSSGDVAYGEVPAYSGTPSRPADEEYDYYDFKGWDKEVVAVTEAVTYTAVFEGHKGKRTNSEEHDYASLKVNGPTNELADDFAFGVDLSMVADVEANGGVYYNEKGDEQDVFKILAADGVNYARLRLWNDPRNAQSAGYGGGNNDLLTDIALAKRAKAAGMKVLLDFHYSDFWVDPIHNQKPKAWHDLANAEIPAAVKAYTKESLQAFKNEGITIDSVQIGNESNSAIAGVGRDDTNFAEVFAQGIAGAKEVFPEIKTIVHLTQTSGNYNSAKTVLAALNTSGVAYDVIGLSYYSYQHGSQADFFDVVNELEGLYHKPVIIAETSYGFTDDWVEGITNNEYWSQEDELPGGYVTGEQGQATLLGHLVDGLSKVANKHGAGIFYWGGDWLPVKGSVSSSKYGTYYQNHGTDGEGEEYLNTWANQALFSYTGKVLPSASTYKHIQDKDRTLAEADDHLDQDEFDVHVNLNTETAASALPAMAVVVTNLNALHSKSIDWDQAEIAAITTDGVYEVHGTVDAFNVVANVTAQSNLVANASFEDGDTPWTISGTGFGISENASDRPSNADGTHYLHWWANSAYTFSASQVIEDVPAGTYDFSILQNGDGTYDSLKLWYKIGENAAVEKDITLAGWNNGKMAVSTFDSIVLAEESDITIGFSASAQSGAWGNSDLWSFSKHQDAPEPTPTPTPSTNLLADGDFAAQTVGSALAAPWTVNKTTGDAHLLVGNTEAMKKEADNYIGWYNTKDPFEAIAFDFSQTVNDLEAGDYVFSFNIFGANQWQYDHFNVYYQVEGGTKVAVDKKTELLGWGEDTDAYTATISIDVTAEEGKSLTVGLEVLSGSEDWTDAWGRAADFALTAK